MLTRIPQHVSDGVVRCKITVIQAALATAVADLAIAKATVDAAVVAGLGMSDAATIALAAKVATASTALTAVSTAITNSGL